MQLPCQVCVEFQKCFVCLTTLSKDSCRRCKIQSQQQKGLKLAPSKLTNRYGNTLNVGQRTLGYGVDIIKQTSTHETWHLLQTTSVMDVTHFQSDQLNANASVQPKPHASVNAAI
jgi:hypothetical protein